MLSDYFQAMLRTDLPLAAPVGTVCVPLVDATRLPGHNDGNLREWILPSLLLALLLPALTSHLAVWLVSLGSVVGCIVAYARGRRFRAGKAIVFDAHGIWNEWPGGASERLPWAGLKFREGRIPGLVAEDGRSVPFQRGAMKDGLDTNYLVALVEGLPRLPGGTYPPTWPLVLGAVLGFCLVLNARETFLSIAPDGPFLSSGRYRYLLSALVGASLVFWATFGVVWRGPADVQKGPPSGIDPRHRWEVVAHFRAHRFRPPPTPLEPGVVYEYLDAGSRRIQASDQEPAKVVKRSPWILVGAGVLVVIVSVAGAIIAFGEPNGKPGTFFAGGAAGLFVLWGLHHQGLTPSPGEMWLRVEGDSAYVWSQGEPEQRFDWPPARTREAREFQDWTDELRAGRRRLRIDRRLLVAARDTIAVDEIPAPA